MLWPDGKLPENWSNFAELLEAGIRGVPARSGINPCPRIVIHIDKDVNRRAALLRSPSVEQLGVEFDVIVVPESATPPSPERRGLSPSPLVAENRAQLDPSQSERPLHR